MKSIFPTERNVCDGSETTAALGCAGGGERGTYSEVTDRKPHTSVRELQLPRCALQTRYGVLH